MTQDDADVMAMRHLARSMYDKGFMDALVNFAHWKDGDQYVGTTGLTLKQAIADRHSLHTYNPPHEG